MASTQLATHRGRTEALERLILEHQEEVARLREEFGDSQLALSAFTRDRLDHESLLEVAHRDGNWPAAEADADDFLDAW